MQKILLKQILITHEIKKEDVSFIPKYNEIMEQKKEDLKSMTNEQKENFVKDLELTRKPLSVTEILSNIFKKYQKYILYFATSQQFYIYNVKQGYYQKYNHNEITALVGEFLHSTPLNSMKIKFFEYASSLVKELTVFNAFLQEPEQERQYLCMENGIFNIQTKTLIKHTHTIFMMRKLGYAYDPRATCPKFESFLEDFCQGHKDRIELIRA